MNLIGPLVAGVRGAENGTVDIYVRGTTTRATYYTDFEGTTPVTPTSSIALDQYGGLQAWVNQYVRCIVKDSTGATVRDFVAGESASSVEVRSPSFTGVDYTSGASATSSPISLEAVLDKWVTSAGEPDWKVLFGGSSKTIQTALSGLSGLFFNVKDPTYGATGDGVANDGSAIAAAVAAASSGGIIFFPPGSYRMTSALAVSGNVDLMGAGAGASSIIIDSANASALSYGSATTKDWQRVSGLTIKNAQANTAGTGLVVVNADARVLVDGCYIGDSVGGNRCVSVTNTNATAAVRNCTLQTSGAAVSHIIGSSSPKQIQVVGCKFVLPATYNGVCIDPGCDLWCAGNEFVNGTVTAGTFTNVKTNSGSAGVIVGNHFLVGGGSTLTPIAFGGTGFHYESGNTFPVAVTPFTVTPTAIAAEQFGSISVARMGHAELATVGAVDFTVNPDVCGSSSIIFSVKGAARVITFKDPLYAGQTYALTLYNSDGTGATGAVSANGTLAVAPYGFGGFTVPASKFTTHFFVAVNSSASARPAWFCVAQDTTGKTP